MLSITIEELQKWVGRQEIIEDIVVPSTVANMIATLGRDDPAPQEGGQLPLPWHWLYFNRGASPSMLGPDGHVADSDFTPPMPLPRRMWAGNRVKVAKPLTLGARAQKISTIEDISEKNGKTGKLVFMRERSDYSDDSGGMITDWRTVVYRDEADGSQVTEPNPAPTNAIWHEEITPDPVLLFRYSALTFNSHRIHYDRDYTTQVEGYPALLVHGPLTATLLINLLRNHMPDAQVTELNVRAMAPVFDHLPFTVNGVPAADGKSVSLWATTSDGGLAMTIDVELG